eukprot:jgi/Botrbrau1/20375/Bobra.0006s0038.1
MPIIGASRKTTKLVVRKVVATGEPRNDLHVCKNLPDDNQDALPSCAYHVRMDYTTCIPSCRYHVHSIVVDNQDVHCHVH